MASLAPHFPVGEPRTVTPPASTTGLAQPTPTRQVRTACGKDVSTMIVTRTPALVYCPACKERLVDGLLFHMA